MARSPEEMSAELREELLRQRASTSEVRGLLDDLAVHQEELRAQQQALVEAQQALELSRDRYAAFFDFAPIGCVSLDFNGTIEEINLTAAQLLGQERARAAGTLLHSHVYEEDRRSFLDHMARCRRGERLVRSELRLKTAGGSIEVELVTKRMQQGERVFLFGVVADLSERRRSEAERIAAEREHQRMLREHEAARVASRAKDEFLAVLSHELRTPLAPILFGLAEVEGRGGLPDASAAVLEMIRRNVELEARLIDDLLDVTRIARGKLSIDAEVLDLHELLCEVARNFEFKARAAGQTFFLDLLARKHRVRGDPARLRQVFANLLENAIRYTPAGGHVGLRSDDLESGGVRVAVSDDGVGIQPADLERIFLPFDQGGTLRRQGLGLGLSICKGLIEAHGGTIRASSAGPGRGARFEIELPAATERPAATPEKMPAAPAAKHKARLLIVEDHIDTAEALALYLRGLGYTVQLAHTLEAASRTDLRHVDVVLSDLQLPDGTGLELLASLRRRGPVRAIAMSGFGGESDRRRSLEAGFHRHLTKPVNVRTMIEAIESVMQ